MSDRSVLVTTSLSPNARPVFSWSAVISTYPVTGPWPRPWPMAWLDTAPAVQPEGSAVGFSIEFVPGVTLTSLIMPGSQDTLWRLHSTLSASGWPRTTSTLGGVRVAVGTMVPVGVSEGVSVSVAVGGVPVGVRVKVGVG